MTKKSSKPVVGTPKATKAIIGILESPAPAPVVPVPVVIHVPLEERVTTLLSEYRAGQEGSRAAAKGAKLARDMMVSFLKGLYSTAQQLRAVLTFLSPDDADLVVSWVHPEKDEEFDLSSLDMSLEIAGLKEAISTFPPEQQKEAALALVNFVRKAIVPKKAK